MDLGSSSWSWFLVVLRAKHRDAFKDSDLASALLRLHGHLLSKTLLPSAAAPLPPSGTPENPLWEFDFTSV